MIHVMIVQGKSESIDYVGIKVFDTKKEAEDFITENNEDEKYYTTCGIVNLDKIYTIGREGIFQTNNFAKTEF